MVSSTSQTDPKSPPLSYAERAKKARNINSQNDAYLPRTHSQSVAATSSSAVSSTAKTASGILSPASNSWAAKAPAAVSIDASPSQIPPSASAPTFPPIIGVAGAKETNGDVKSSNVDSSASPIDSPAASAPRSVSAPVVNVWHLRKEQMARALSHSQAAASPSVAANPAPVVMSDTASSSPHAHRASDSVPMSTDLTAVPSAPQDVSDRKLTRDSPPAATTNGHPPESDTDDPFVVRPYLAPLVAGRVSLPSEDAESWPEVGKPADTPTGSNRTSSRSSDAQNREAIERGEKAENREVLNSAPRKSEKTKWVPIPPEELQAAADAQQPKRLNSQSGSRARTHQQAHRRGQVSTSGSGSPSASGSISGQASQGQSRTHSAVGMRHSASHSSSVAHSRNQSRTGSVQSSPRHPSTHGGCRALPEGNAAVGVTPPHNVDGSIRSSTDSPQPSIRAPPTTVEDHVPTVGASPVSYMNRAHGGSQATDDPPHSVVIDGSTYYQPLPPPLSSASHSYHSTRASNSPATHSYALPPSAPAMFPNHQGGPTPLPPHPGYTGPPSYAGYTPYGYPPYAQPYMYWGSQDRGNPYATGPGPHAHSQGQGQPPHASNTREAESSIGLPPPTLMARPPPPGESNAVAGYREVGLAQPAVPAAHVAHEGEEAGRSRELSFGSIDLAVPNRTPSPAPVPPVLAPVAEGEVSSEKEEGETGLEKAFTMFSIGVAPGEPGPSRIRSRTKTQPKASVTMRRRVETAPAILGPGREDAASEAGEDREGVEAQYQEENEVKEVKVIDLTDPETKWEFGTAKQVEGEQEGPVGRTEQPPNALGVSSVPGVVPTGAVISAGGTLATPPSAPSPVMDPAHLHHQPYAPSLRLSPLGPVMMPNGLPTMPVPSSATAIHPPASALSPSSAVGPGGDEWEVKDYGFGFGRGGGPAYGPGTTREEQHARERERQRERDGNREARDFHRDRGEREFHPGRPRRGSYGGGYVYERGGHDRGGYSGRRGRGTNGYGGRGFHGRGFAGRGGFQQSQHRSAFPVTQAAPPPPPAETNGYYAAPLPPATTYFPPAGYDIYAPYPAYPPAPPAPAPPAAQPTAPMPVPLSAVSFPLDPTRYYLLGQLEYYLSAQNLAQDFFLRQRMDSRGWISIPLLASFNRVRQLTLDVQLVRDVLTLSSLVEVKGDWVRMRQWQGFVLPTAPTSTVEEDPGSAQRSHSMSEGDRTSAGDDCGEVDSTSHEGEEDDEEEVEFVLGRDAKSNSYWGGTRHVPESPGTNSGEIPAS